MVTTFAEIFAEQTGIVPVAQDLTLYQGSAWYPGAHVAASIYTKAFYMQMRVNADDAVAVATLSSPNGGIKHWGSDFFNSTALTAGGNAAGIWKTFSLLLYNMIKGINSDLTTKYSQTDQQADGLYDLFLSAQQSGALTFSKAGYDTDMIPMKKLDSGAATTMVGSTWDLTNNGTALIGPDNDQLAVGRITEVGGVTTPFTDIEVGDLIRFDYTGTDATPENFGDPDGNYTFALHYRVTKATSPTVIEIDRPWHTIESGKTLVSCISTGLPMQISPSAGARAWMSVGVDDYTSIDIDADDDSGGTKLTFVGAAFDLGVGLWAPAVGDIVLVSGQENIVSGEADISGLQTISAITTGTGTSTMTFSGVTSGGDRSTVADIVISALHEGLITRIQSGKITLDDTHAHDY